MERKVDLSLFLAACFSNLDLFAVEFLVASRSTFKTENLISGLQAR